MTKFNFSKKWCEKGAEMEKGFVVGAAAPKDSPLYKEMVKTFKVVMTNHTNVTAYLIWHYLTNRRFGLALHEYLNDGDKINGAWLVQGRREIKSALETLARENP